MPHQHNALPSLACYVKRPHVLLLLGTAKILVSDASSKYFQTVVIISTVSQTSAITRSFANKLGLPIRLSTYQIIGIPAEKARVIGITTCTPTS